MDKLPVTEAKKQYCCWTKLKLKAALMINTSLWCIYQLYSRRDSHDNHHCISTSVVEQRNSLIISFFLCSYPLYATAHWHSLHRMCSLCCHGDSLLGFLGDRDGVRERPCCLRLDQVCSLCLHVVSGLFVSSMSSVCSRYDPAEMLCAVFFESSYSDMLVYILCAFSICIFLPFLLIFFCSLLSATCCRSRCNR